MGMADRIQKMYVSKVSFYQDAVNSTGPSLRPWVAIAAGSVGVYGGTIVAQSAANLAIEAGQKTIKSVAKNFAEGEPWAAGGQLIGGGVATVAYGLMTGAAAMTGVAMTHGAVRSLLNQPALSA